MQMRPLIGISCMNSRAASGGASMAVRPSYLRAIEAAGGVPLLIYLTDDLGAVRTIYDLCQGVLLPGGDDLDPGNFGEEPHTQLGDVDRQRDAVELTLARWCRDEGKPLFGICRGMQVINVAFGGSLYQDIPSQLPDTQNHRASTDRKQWDYIAHSVRLDPESWLAARLGPTPVAANTLHHQALKDVAPNLRVAGTAEDGVIEAVEGTGKHFVVAVQCHPEHLWAATEPRWKAVFDGFVAECRAYDNRGL
jgi:putative glutamine amidotransferase